jgi:hypothetical protein
MKRLIIRGIAWILVVLGILGAIVGVLAIVDPVGSKMADDAAPFGVPPSRKELLAITLVYVLVGFTGLAILRRTRAKNAA